MTKFNIRVDNVEAYLSGYEGAARQSRLKWLSEHLSSTELSLQCALQLLGELKSANATRLYKELCERFSSHSNAQITSSISLDNSWYAATEKELSLRLQSLDEALLDARQKRDKSLQYKYNDAIGRHYFALGQYHSARDVFARNKGLCVDSADTIRMCVQLIRANWAMDSYDAAKDTAAIALAVFDGAAALSDDQCTRVFACSTSAAAAPYTPTALESGKASSAASSSSSSPSSMPAASHEAANAHRAALLSVLHAVSGVAFMRRGMFERAAEHFASVSKQLGANFASLVTLKEVAVYAALCALASFDRDTLMAHQGRAEFAQLLRQAPVAVELVNQFTSGHVATCMQRLEALVGKLEADYHLHGKTSALRSHIRRRAVLQYVMPYSAVRLDKMAQSFGTSVAELERELADLVASGRLAARIDSRDKIMHATTSNQRAATFQSAFDTASYFERSADTLLFRMQLTQQTFTSDRGLSPSSSSFSSQSSSSAFHRYDD
jgi:COP9 signalosome complex subunit 1